MLENKKNLGIQIISNLQIQTNYIPKCKKNLHIISEPLAVSLRNHKEWERCQKPWEMFYFAISWKLKIHKLDVILKEGEPCGDQNTPALPMRVVVKLESSNKE